MNQVEAQKKWYRCQFRTPLHEVLPQPIYRKQENGTWKECDVAKTGMLFLSRKIEAQASRSVCRPGVSECSVSCIRVLGKVACGGTDAMEKQNYLDRRGWPKTPMMRFVVAVRLP
jgi:hypothetical protein